MPTLYFSYSDGGKDILNCDEPLSSPYTITWNVGRFLRDKAASIGYDFAYKNLDDTTPVEFDPSDIVIGHCWWEGGFMHQALDANVKAKFILQPYSHGMVSPGDVEMVHSLFIKADHLFLITGEHWFNTMPDSPYASLQHKAIRLDMAVSPAMHPFSKTTWNKPGKRAICVIGHDTWAKGYKNVAVLARAAGIHLGHFGSTDGYSFAHVPSLTLHGGVLFTPESIAVVCSQYDAIVTLAEYDANPTVLLEAASWGLRVYANREAGYLPNRPFEELRKDDMSFNVAQMRALQQMSDYELNATRDHVRRVVASEYTFDRLCQTIWQTVETFL